MFVFIERTELQRVARGIFTGIVYWSEAPDVWQGILDFSEMCSAVPLQDHKRRPELSMIIFTQLGQEEHFNEFRYNGSSGSNLIRSLAQEAKLDESVLYQLYRIAVIENLFEPEHPLALPELSVLQQEMLTFQFVTAYVASMLPGYRIRQLRNNVRNLIIRGKRDEIPRLLQGSVSEHEFRHGFVPFVQSCDPKWTGIDSIQTYRYFLSFLAHGIDVFEKPSLS